MLMILFSFLLFGGALAAALSITAGTIAPAMPRMAALLAEQFAHGRAGDLRPVPPAMARRIRLAG